MFLVLFVLSALFAALSLRLLRSAYRSGGAEGWLGLAFLSVATSMPVRALLSMQTPDGEAPAPVLLLATHAWMSLGLCALTLFVDRVFRPDAGWAHGVTATLIALQIVTLPALVFYGAHRTEHSFASVAVGLVRALPFAWGFLEAWRFHRQMRRRATLGLSDPVVTNRFALFATWNGALCTLLVGLFGLRSFALYGTDSGRLVGDGDTASMLAATLAVGLGVLGGSAIVALWLSFFPPRFWIRRLERDDPAPA